jgi:hypothetical protein
VLNWLNFGNAWCNSVPNVYLPVPHQEAQRLNKTIILPVVMYGCKTWYPKLREESILRAFENRVLR